MKKLIFSPRKTIIEKHPEWDARISRSCWNCIFGSGICLRHAPVVAKNSDGTNHEWPIIVERLSTWCGDHQLERRGNDR